MAIYDYNNKNDGIRKSLRELINNTGSPNESADRFVYENTLLDITGSLGCWGIAQVNKDGRLER